MKKCRFCAEEIQDEAAICKHCGKKQASSNLPRTLLLWFGGLLFLIIVLAFLSSMSSDSTTRLDPSRDRPSGSSARLIYQDQDKVPVYLTEEDIWEADTAIKANDKTALTRMLIDRRLFWLPAGTRVTLLSFGKAGTRQIMTEDGREGWVASKGITD